MSHHRLRAVTLVVLIAGLAGSSSLAHAAAQVSKFNLMLSVNPTQIKPDDFNKTIIDNLNRTQLEPRGLEGLDTIGFAWFYDFQLRYFLRPNFAVEAGAGQIRSSVKQEYLPALNTAIEFRAEVLSIPVHVGGAYYLPAYTQGDFSARIYAGGGFTSLVYNRGRFQGASSGVDSATAAQSNFFLNSKGDSPGYYLETGFHLFFASRYSVLLGGMYRSALVRHMFATRVNSLQGGQEVVTPLGQIFELDTSGLGARFGVAIGF